MNRPLARNKILPVLKILKNLKRANGFHGSCSRHYWPNHYWPMLVDIVTAITGPFGFCTGKSVQVEQMSNDSHY